MEQIMFRQGSEIYVSWKCRQCGKCCTRRGINTIPEEDPERYSIKLSPWEVFRMARFLNVSTETFLSEYCRKIRRIEYALKAVDEDQKCIFLRPAEGGKSICKVHKVCPTACYTFPIVLSNEGCGFYMPILKVGGCDFESVQKLKDIIPQEKFQQDRERGNKWEVLTKLYPSIHAPTEDEAFRQFMFVNKSEYDIDNKVNQFFH